MLGNITNQPRNFSGTAEHICDAWVVLRIWGFGPMSLVFVRYMARLRGHTQRQRLRMLERVCVTPVQAALVFHSQYTIYTH